jgi:hypothetical protein
LNAVVGAIGFPADAADIPSKKNSRQHQRAKQRHHSTAHAHTARPQIASGEYQRRATDDESNRRRRVHRDEARKHPLQHIDLQNPADQRQTGHGEDDRGAKAQATLEAHTL